MEREKRELLTMQLEGGREKTCKMVVEEREGLEVTEVKRELVRMQLERD